VHRRPLDALLRAAALHEREHLVDFLGDRRAQDVRLAVGDEHRVFDPDVQVLVRISMIGSTAMTMPGRNGSV
jgi:hypothetical protein